MFSDNEAREIEQAKREKQEYERLLSDMETVLSTNQGRNVIWWVLSQCGIYDTNFAEDDRKTNFLLGRRDVGLAVIGLMSDIDNLTYPNLQLRMGKDERK